MNSDHAIPNERLIEYTISIANSLSLEPEEGKFDLIYKYLIDYPKYWLSIHPKMEICDHSIASVCIGYLLPTEEKTAEMYIRFFVKPKENK